MYQTRIHEFIEPALLGESVGGCPAAYVVLILYTNDDAPNIRLEEGGERHQLYTLHETINWGKSLSLYLSLEIHWL